MTAEEIVTAVKALSPEDQARFREWLDCQLNAPQRSEEELDRILVEKGLLSGTPGGLSQEQFDSFQPITVEGEPLSETIMRERR